MSWICNLYTLENSWNEIRHYQGNGTLLFSKPAFTRVAQEIFADITKSGSTNVGSIRVFHQSNWTHGLSVSARSGLTLNLLSHY